MMLYIFKRLVSIIPILLVVAIAIFSIIHLTPGDPATTILGSEASPEQLESLREELGLNRPLPEQFIFWILDVVRGDLGSSIFMNKPVSEVFLSHLGPTLSLSIFAQIIAILIAIPSGVLASRKRGKATDQFVMSTALLGISIPSFLLGLFFILVFSVNLGWFPVSGYKPLSAGFFTHLEYLVLPAVALGFMQSALITRMTRSSMLDTLSQNFIKTARSKGLSQSIVIYKHALRNAFVTILEVIGHSFTTLLAGAVVVEFVFNIPGVGQLIVNSIGRRDFTLIQGSVLLIAIAYVFINLIIDLLYGVVDPRVRLNRK
ncbi:ABC transporter permease [Bacillus sp. DTU_2020_1000418_1_SI_GHA_SEK_038]|uniref:ABC transporter permease n=1 Tax=Bacillus sp. DTU_2020_1000418_1_SI_GHA_SEK_038 TaxID=3077585 RepID=UPI0028E70E4C|nr:ABC transporter permease [Bacillus sp. DTU_2020_1000418_1_SI_GHA_SEK_038]WNS75165.1 ABC transporter permease [Bacillus sp. DTU_2020_1000418_1_SI_GHA_SEK_038]